MISKLQYISQGQTVEEQLLNIKQVCEAGADWIQLRIKDQPEEVVLDAAKKTKVICELFGAQLIINDNINVAQKVKAAGVHLGKTDTSPSEARGVLGKDFIIGGTANTLDDCLYLIKQGVDYIGLGPYRFTKTKKNLSPVLGIGGYEGIINALLKKDIKLPVIAIGGVLTDDVLSLNRVGIYGIAVSGILTNTADKSGIIKEFKTMLS